MIESIAGVHIVDFFVLIIVFFSALIALIRGFAREFLGILGWVGAVFVTLYGLPYIRPVARNMVDNPIIADIGGGAFLLSTHSLLSHL